MGGHIMGRATMPEAAIDEHRDLSASKGDIDAAAPVPGHRPMDPVPQPGAMEEMPQLQLRARVAPTVGLHVPAYRGRAGPRYGCRTAARLTRRSDGSLGGTSVHASSVLQRGSG